ncbi:MAG: hypothetical protein ACYC57_09600, partial [Thermoleophilia bacterium]
ISTSASAPAMMATRLSFQVDFIPSPPVCFTNTWSGSNVRSRTCDYGSYHHLLSDFLISIFKGKRVAPSGLEIGILEVQTSFTTG